MFKSNIIMFRYPFFLSIFGQNNFIFSFSNRIVANLRSVRWLISKLNFTSILLIQHHAIQRYNYPSVVMVGFSEQKLDTSTIKIGSRFLKSPAMFGILFNAVAWAVHLNKGQKNIFNFWGNFLLDLDETPKVPARCQARQKFVQITSPL